MNITKEDVPEETLNEVFLTRSKIGKYFSIPDDKRDIMLQYFQKNPYPKKEELLFLSHCTLIDKNKIQNWFKYQRQKDFKTTKTIIKTYKCNRKFTREGKKILELYFRKSHELSENALKKLSTLLKCEKSQIERWFYYRNKKLNSLLNKKDSSQIEEEKDPAEESILPSDIEEKSDKKTVATQEDEINIPKKPEIPSFSTPFSFPSFHLPPPPMPPSHLLLGNNLPLLGKFPGPFNQMWPNMALMNGFLMKRNEIYQNTISNMMQSVLKKEEEMKVKKEEGEVLVKKEEGVNVKKEEEA